MRDYELAYRNKHLSKGRNALCKDDPRLKGKWKWSKHPIDYDGNRATKWRRCPGQCSEVNLKNDFQLKVVDWHDNYEARISRRGECLLSTDWENTEKLETRLEAQIKAEQLIQEFIDLLTEARDKLNV